MKDFPVTCRLPVFWGDMDALGHVNNVRYLTWFESVRIALFEQVGLVGEGAKDVGPILASTTCDFLTPVTYPDDIVAGTRIARVGTTSFLMEYGIARTAEPDRLVAKGSGVIVLYDYVAGHKVAISAELRSALEALAP